MLTIKPRRSRRTTRRLPTEECGREVHEGRNYTVNNLEFHECSDCKEQVYDGEAMRAIEANSPALAKSVVT